MRSLATGLAGAVLLLGGCGGGTTFSPPTGADVATDAAEAVESAGSVHVSGAMTKAGTEQAVDLHLQGDDVSASSRPAGRSSSCW